MHDLKAAVIHLVDRHGNRFGIQRFARGLRSGGDVARAARDALLASTEDDVTISALAQELGASPSQLAASFRGVYGMTPAAFLRAQKMHSAAQLLRTSDRTVLDIAGQFGYDNASKFAKAFRSVIGVSPSAYRAGADSDSCAPTAEKAE